MNLVLPQDGQDPVRLSGLPWNENEVDMAKGSRKGGGVKKGGRRSAAPRTPKQDDGRRRIRYAVVGLGHIAQVAVLPAFAHAGENSELVALFSDDAEKLAKLGRKYRLKHLFDYDEFEEGLKAADVDAARDDVAPRA